VIFDENNSFDHYFGTYPDAANPPGEPPFTPLPNTPTVNGLTSADREQSEFDEAVPSGPESRSSLR
jgi:phospholipase C